MKRAFWIVAFALLIAGSSSVFADDTDYQWRKNQEEPGEWTVPECDRVIGTMAFTFTTDGGLTLAEAGLLRKLTYSYGLAALDVSNTLLATSMTNAGTSIIRSEDAGCNWRQVELLPVNELLLLTAGPGDVAYGWSRGRTLFYRIEGDRVTTLPAPNVVYGLAVDPDDAAHIRIGSVDCQIYESFDGGASFAPLGNPAGTGNTVFFSVEFAPDDMDCALCGSKGAWRTTDGGSSWSVIAPFDKEDIDIVHLFVFSPNNPQLVWARANMETMGGNYRDILVSDDGGATFETAVRQLDVAQDQNGIDRKVILTNQPTMAAHPEQDALYFAWGTYNQDYFTDLFKYDVSNDELSVVHIDGLDGIDAIAFNPADASVMYLGLEEEGTWFAPTAKGDAGESAIKVSVAPNPFNPSADLSFSLPEAARVKLDVYNLAGQKVATVVDRYMNAGEHTVTWNAGRFASGVYLARLEAGSFTDTRKMILLK